MDRPRNRFTEDWVVKWETRPKNLWLYQSRRFPDNDEGKTDAYRFCLRLMQRQSIVQDVKRLRVCRPVHYFGALRTTQMRDGLIIRPEIPQEVRIAAEVIEYDRDIAIKIAARWKDTLAEISGGISRSTTRATSRTRPEGIRQASPVVRGLQDRVSDEELFERCRALRLAERGARCQVPGVAQSQSAIASTLRRTAGLRWA